MNRHLRRRPTCTPQSATRMHTTNPREQRGRSRVVGRVVSVSIELIYPTNPPAAVRPMPTSPEKKGSHILYTTKKKPPPSPPPPPPFLSPSTRVVSNRFFSKVRAIERGSPKRKEKNIGEGPKKRNKEQEIESYKRFLSSKLLFLLQIQCYVSVRKEERLGEDGVDRTKTEQLVGHNTTHTQTG